MKSKRRKLNRYIPPSPLVVEPKQERKPEPSPGRPQGSIGLKKQLVAEHCNGDPSATQLLLIDALCSLVSASRDGDLSPRDLLSNFSSQRGIVKLLNDMAANRNGRPNDPQETSYDDLSISEIDAKLKETESLLDDPRIVDDDSKTHGIWHIGATLHKHHRGKAEEIFGQGQGIHVGEES